MDEPATTGVAVADVPAQEVKQEQPVEPERTNGVHEMKQYQTKGPGGDENQGATEGEKVEDPKPEAEQEITAAAAAQEPQINSAEQVLEAPEKTRTEDDQGKQGNAWQQPENAGPEQQNGTPSDNRLETDAEQEIAAALFDLANNAAKAEEEEEEDDYHHMQMQTLKVPKGHTINDLNLTSRKRPRKPNRNYAIFEDPGDDDDEDWDAEDEYLHNRMASRTRGRGGGRASKSTRQDMGGYQRGGRGGGGGGGYDAHHGYDGRLAPQYIQPPGNMPQYQPPFPPMMGGPGAMPMAARPPPVFKRGANHIAIAHFIQWHKQSNGGGYAPPPPQPQHQPMQQQHPGMMMPPQLGGGHPDVAQALQNVLGRQYPGLPPNLPPALLAQLRPPGQGPRPMAPGLGNVAMPPAYMPPGGVPNRPELEQMLKASQFKQMGDLLMAANQRRGMDGQQQPGMPGFPKLGQNQPWQPPASGQMPQAPGQPGPPRPGGPALSQDALQALRALQSALPYLTSAASGQGAGQGGAEAMKSLQQTLQSAISKLPAGGAGGGPTATGAQPQLPPGVPPGSALAAALAGVLRQQQQQQAPQGPAAQQPGAPAAGAGEQPKATDGAEGTNRPAAGEGDKAEGPAKSGEAPKEGTATETAEAPKQPAAPAGIPPNFAAMLPGLLQSMQGGAASNPGALAAAIAAIRSQLAAQQQGGGDGAAQAPPLDAMALLAKLAPNLPVPQVNGANNGAPVAPPANAQEAPSDAAAAEEAPAENEQQQQQPAEEDAPAAEKAAEPVETEAAASK